MLIDFSFSNYRSFDADQTFSMRRERRYMDAGSEDISTVAAVYGANASGKSNFLRAIHAMQQMVLTSYSSGDADSGIQRDSFRLREDFSKRPTLFLVECIADDRQKYRYSFGFDDKRILDEELVFYKKVGNRWSSRSSLLFTREESGDIKFGAAFKGPRAQVKKTVELRPNALLLSASAAAGIESIRPIFRFFADELTYCDAIAYTAEVPRMFDEYRSGSRFSQNLTKLIRYADFGITDVQTEKAPQELIEQLAKQVKDQFGEDAQLGDVGDLQFTHAGKEVSAKFDQAGESRGTLAAMSFFSLALRQLSKESVTIIDEIDTSLHPTLVKEFIELYTDPMTNPHRAQLIITTHDVSLINYSGMMSPLDPDQIWLVEKNSEGASELYPVTDLGIRKGENIGKNYLNGVYGANPKPSFHMAFAQMMSGEGA